MPAVKANDIGIGNRPGMTRRRGLLVLAFIVLACLNYNPQLLFETQYRHWGWNLSLLATILIILIFRNRDPEHWRERLGIHFSIRDGAGFVMTSMLLLIAGYYFVRTLSRTDGYLYIPKIIHYATHSAPDGTVLAVLGEYLYYIMQTLNEEMLMGAVVLMGLERSFKYSNRNAIAIVVALVFSLMHQAMYVCSPVQPDMALETRTLLSLFCVGLLRNVLILKTRKITYAWAIHLVFNLIFFPGIFIDRETDRWASEPERFNIVFGQSTMVGVTILLAIAALIWLNWNGTSVHRHQNNPKNP